MRVENLTKQLPLARVHPANPVGKRNAATQRTMGKLSQESGYSGPAGVAREAVDAVAGFSAQSA